MGSLSWYSDEYCIGQRLVDHGNRVPRCVDPNELSDIEHVCVDRQRHCTISIIRLFMNSERSFRRRVQLMTRDDIVTVTVDTSRQLTISRETLSARRMARGDSYLLPTYTCM